MNFDELQQVGPGNYIYDVSDQLRRHVYRRTLRAIRRGEQARDALTSPAQVRERQAFIRKRYLQCLAGLPASDAPLNARTVGTIQHHGLTIEKVIYDARPGHPVTANVYLPPHLIDPTGAVLFLCGHLAQAKSDPEYQAVCQTLAHAGLVVLAMDPIGQGERLSYLDEKTGRPMVDPGTAEHDHVGTQCLLMGQPLARYFLHDAMRSLDYLASRPEVDATRLGVTGNSGGGLQTAMLMMTEPRLAAAAPGTFVMDRRSYLFTGQAQDAEQIWPGFTAAGLDHEDFLIAMAPRPVCVLAVTSDFFPIEGTRRTVQRAKRIYTLMKAPGALQLVEDDSRHRYTPVLAEAAARFFQRRLLRIDSVEALPASQPLPAEQLHCTEHGQLLHSLPGTQTVWDDLQSALPASPRGADKAWLTLRIRPSRRRPPLNLRRYIEQSVEDLVVEGLLWWSQPGLFNHGLLLQRPPRAHHPSHVVVGLWEGGTTRLAEHRDWIVQQCRDDVAVLVLDPVASGGLAPRGLNQRAVDDPYGALHRLNDDLLFLGDSLAALRVRDLLRLPELIAHLSNGVQSTVSLHAHGRWTHLAEMAGRLEPRLQVSAIGSNDSSSFPHALVRSRYYQAQGVRSFVLPSSVMTARQR